MGTASTYDLDSKARNHRIGKLRTYYEELAKYLPGNTQILKAL
jgi:hypothetical protein